MSCPSCSRHRPTRSCASTLAAFVEANDLGPHKGVKLLGSYLRAQQKAGRVRADADADAIALLIIDVRLFTRRPQADAAP